MVKGKGPTRGQFLTGGALVTAAGLLDFGYGKGKEGQQGRIAGEEATIASLQRTLADVTALMLKGVEDGTIAKSVGDEFLRLTASKEVQNVTGVQGPSATPSPTVSAPHVSKATPTPTPHK